VIVRATFVWNEPERAVRLFVRNGARNIEAVVLQWQLDGTRPRHLDGPSLRRFPSVGDPLCGYGSCDDNDDDDEEDEEEDEEEGS
jgi:hypothetical protein